MTNSSITKLGLTEEEILDLTSEKNNHPRFRGAPYWTAEIYSFGKYIRQYGYYPHFLPLAIYTDHGPGRIIGQPAKHELDTDAPVMFYHSQASVEIWKQFSRKPGYVLFSPFVFYRRHYNIQPLPTAQGTIVFVNHATADIDDVSDTQAYIDQLQDLPPKFQPISVCLHITDIKQGRHRIFMDNHIPVYTAGGNSEHFAARFYNILRQFKYASSNLVNSSLFYAVEMGVPFFIYGNKPENINRGNQNLPLGRYDFYEGREYFQRLDRLFRNLDCEITAEKTGLIEQDLGIKEGLSRLKMATVLYSALLRWFFSPAFYKWVQRSWQKISGSKN